MWRACISNASSPLHRHVKGMSGSARVHPWRNRATQHDEHVLDRALSERFFLLSEIGPTSFLVGAASNNTNGGSSSSVTSNSTASAPNAATTEGCDAGNRAVGPVRPRKGDLAAITGKFKVVIGSVQQCSCQGQGASGAAEATGAAAPAQAAGLSSSSSSAASSSSSSTGGPKLCQHIAFVMLKVLKVGSLYFCLAIRLHLRSH